jgi:hypothetical protein
MLGTARASEYAGWWSTGLNSVAFSSTSTLGSEIYQTPTYSWLMNNTDRSIDGVGNTGTIDLTGLTGFTGFDNLRSARIVNFYFPSTVWNSAAAGSIRVTQSNDLWNGATSTQYPFQVQVSLDTAGAIKQFRFASIFLSFSGAGNATLPGAHTQYTDTWLTVVSVTAETSSVFAEWAGGAQGTNTQATRIAVYNTATGALIVKSDAWRNSTTASPTWPTLSTITNPLPQESGPNWYQDVSSFTSTGYETRIAGMWVGLGTTFDPLSETNTSWRTALPTETIGNAQSWMNIQFSRYQDAGNVFPKFYGNASGQDLYTESSNRVIKYGTVDQAAFDAGYSDTIIIKDSS